MTDDEGIEVKGPLFAIIPEWVLDGASDRAIHLYARLNRYSNKGRAWPSRATLAKHLNCSPASVDRAVKELVCMGAMTVELRKDPENPKRYLSSLYTLLSVKGGSPTGEATPSPTGETGVVPPVMTERKPLNESKQKLERRTSTPDIFPIGGDLAKWTLLRLRRDVISSQRDEFLDHHRAKGSKFADWNAAWRTWVNNCVRFHPEMAASCEAPTADGYYLTSEGLRITEDNYL